MGQFSEKEKRDIINALITIKSVCQINGDDCDNCPFGYGLNCVIMTCSPSDWTVRTTETVWKALE